MPRPAHATRSLSALPLLLLMTLACAPAGTPGPAPATTSASTGSPATAPAGAPQSPAPPSAPGSPGPQGAPPTQALASITYGWQLTAFTWPSFIAMANRYFQEAGLAVDVILIGGGGTAATQLLVSGGAQVVAGGPETVILANERGDDTIFIGAEGLRAPHRIVARPGLSRLDDLRGKQISVPDLVQGATLVLQKHLSANGIRPGEYDLIPSGGSQNRFAALTSGAVDAAILGQPLDFQALDQGYVGLGLTSDTLRDWLFTVYSVRRSWATANPEAATRFIKGLQTAGAWLYDPQNKESAIAVLREYTKSDDLVARRTYDLFITELAVLSRDAEIREQYLRPLVDAMVETDLLPQSPSSLTRYYDNTYVDRARR